jgi:O-antigen ligase
MTVDKPIMAPFWLAAWSATLAAGWLLPNHYLPWLAFHTDAWVAATVALACAAVVLSTNGDFYVHRITVLVVLLIGVPWLQYGFGLIPQPGVAWITSAYLLGLFLALLVGARWESSSPGQTGDGLFLAIGIAAVLSVGLQLQQWLQLDGLELWKMGGGAQRPHANLGQSNQLGTFLLWGVLAAGWGFSRKHISGWCSLLLAAFLLFGLALTGSRTAWIGLALLVGGAWFWGSLWRSTRVPLVVTGLGLYFVVCIATESWLGNFLLGHAPSPDYLNAMSGQHRLLAWAAFCDAIGQRPWFGYGWYQVVSAQMAVAIEHPTLDGVFTSTHNLFLDLLLWLGIPMGLFVSVSLGVWFWRKIVTIRNDEEAVLVLLLAVVANHAMLELPLHYAYLLLPVGLVMGILNTRMGEAPVFFMHRWVFTGVSLVATVLLALIIRDYMRVETSHENFRMERMRIKVAHLDPPDLLLLTQWRDFIDVTRVEARRDMPPAEIDQIRRVTNLFGGALFIHKLATVLALNHQSDEAKLWLMRLCKSAPAQHCIDAQNIWKRQALKYPEIAAIPWPIQP